MINKRNIYQHKLLKYPLTDDEIDKINNVWNFISIFVNKHVNITNYRNYLIHEIRSKYDPKTFYLYENIANKLLWNLRFMLYPLWKNPNISYQEYVITLNKLKYIPKEILCYNIINYKADDELDGTINNIMLNNNPYYRSYVNKMFLIDKPNKKLYIKPIEGSANIFSKNYFNVLTMMIFLNRTLYEQIMLNPLMLKTMDLNIPEYYYQFDYGFPNLNLCVYKFGDETTRIDRINKMYYADDMGNNWFKLIK